MKFPSHDFSISTHHQNHLKLFQNVLSNSKSLSLKTSKHYQVRMWKMLTRKMKDSGIEWIGEIPENWEVKKVKYMFRIVNGNGFPENLQGEKEGDYTFYKNSDINKLGIYINKSNNYISKNTATINKFTVIPSKSILIGKIGEALKRNHRKTNLSECMIDNNMMALVPKENELFS